MSTTRLIKKLSPLVANQLPEHIREANPTFVRFIEAYYEFLEQDQASQEVLQNALLYNDVDTTIDLFIEKFLKQYGSSIPRDIAANKKLLIKNVKDLYNAKGSEKSFSLLLQLLFGESPDYLYPYDQVLKVSAGTWTQDVSVYIQTVYGDPDTVINQTCDVISSTKRTLVKILKKKSVEVIFNSELQVSNDIYEYVIDNTLNVNIAVGDTILSDTFKGVVVSAPVSVEVISAGTGFRVGDVLDVKILDGIGARLKVIKVDSNSGIKNLQFLKYGVNYPSEFFITFSSASRASVTTSFSSIASNVILSDNVGNFIEVGTVNSVDYAPDTFDGTYAGEILRTFIYDSSTTIIGTGNDAVFKITTGAKVFYPGYYKDTGGFLSDDYYLQDRDYYQPYAYVLKIARQLKEYKQAVLELIHPAGMKLHGDYSILNIITTEANITTRVGFSINDILDSFNVADDGAILTINKAVTESLVVGDTTGITFTQSPIEEAMQALDAASALLNSSVLETVNEEDSDSKDIQIVAQQPDYGPDYFSEVYTEGVPYDTIDLVDSITIDVNP